MKLTKYVKCAAAALLCLAAIAGLFSSCRRAGGPLPSSPANQKAPPPVNIVLHREMFPYTHDDGEGPESLEAPYYTVSGLADVKLQKKINNVLRDFFLTGIDTALVVSGSEGEGASDAGPFHFEDSAVSAQVVLRRYISVAREWGKGGGWTSKTFSLLDGGEVTGLINSAGLVTLLQNGKLTQRAPEKPAELAIPYADRIAAGEIPQYYFTRDGVVFFCEGTAPAPGVLWRFEIKFSGAQELLSPALRQAIAEEPDPDAPTLSAAPIDADSDDHGASPTQGSLPENPYVDRLASAPSAN
ncbi:MAG: hypothetical protein LBJ11_08895 [Oscillospiraceae bacterium]|jgi:hypothetical protein|nr:hypothetical protein [Oscillospiraceae bacterium]